MAGHALLAKFMSLDSHESLRSPPKPSGSFCEPQLCARDITCQGPQVPWGRTAAQGTDAWDIKQSEGQRLEWRCGDRVQGWTSPPDWERAEEEAGGSSRWVSNRRGSPGESQRTLSHYPPSPSQATGRLMWSQGWGPGWGPEWAYSLSLPGGCRVRESGPAKPAQEPLPGSPGPRLQPQRAPPRTGKRSLGEGDEGPPVSPG